MMRTTTAPPSKGLTPSGCLALTKPRIALTIALTAVTGYGAVARHPAAPAALLLGLAMVLASGGAAAFNHVWDRDIDRLMRRTRNRPLASGRVEVLPAMAFAALLFGAGLGLALAAFNWVVALHLFLGAFVYAIVYTVWLKRRTALNIVVGGAAGSFAMLAGAAAAEPTAWTLPLLLALTLFLWTPSHFWALAILLAEDYRAAGVPMLPVVVGDRAAAGWIGLNSGLMVASSLLPWGLGLLGPIYGAAALVLGLALMALNLELVITPSRFWAGWNFAASIPYLLGLFAAIVIDRHWG